VDFTYRRLNPAVTHGLFPAQGAERFYHFFLTYEAAAVLAWYFGPG